MASARCDTQLPTSATTGDPAAADGGARADGAGGHPKDAPAEDEVSPASQWTDHASFAHAPSNKHLSPARCAPGLAGSDLADPLDLNTTLRVCTLESSPGGSQTYSTRSSSTHTLQLPIRLAVHFWDPAVHLINANPHHLAGLEAWTQLPRAHQAHTCAYPCGICHGHIAHSPDGTHPPKMAFLPAYSDLWDHPPPIPGTLPDTQVIFPAASAA